MPSTPVTAFSEIVDTVARLVSAVAENQWTAPTPCTDWTIRQLVDHLMAGQELFVGVMSERPTAQIGEPAQAAPVNEAFRASAARLVDAFGQQGALDRIVQAPIGAVPGAVALHLQTLEHLVHGWDLAHAIGEKPSFDDSVVEEEIEFARGVVAQLPPGPNSPFAPSRPAPEHAPAIDRLAALLGRTVTG